jgi:Ni/Fe-hydrogenase subunit HybB-like protein
MSHATAPVGGRILTKPMLVLLGLFGLAAALLLWRFIQGLGAVTAMNDRFPWGLWIAYDVVTGTALACGGYALAILIYILNKGRFHPLIRSAILTSALGYTLGGFSVIVDLGRFWNVWKVPTLFWKWNFSSILLEVALCIMAYMFVLWIELAPAFLEGAKAAASPKLRRLAETTLGPLEKAMPFLVALGLLLPTMHQSSLGSLMMLAGQKVHPLWQTPLLPLLFLISCISMGYGVVVLESALSSTYFGLPRETPLLRRLGRVVAPVLGLYLVLRLGDLAIHGKLGLIFTSGFFSVLFLAEMALFVTPIVLIYAQAQPKLGQLFRAAMAIVLAGALYRFSTFLVAFRPSKGWVYFPSVGETLITVGLIAGEIAAYIFVVKKFPILQSRPPRASVRRLGADVIDRLPIPSTAPASGD